MLTLEIFGWQNKIGSKIKEKVAQNARLWQNFEGTKFLNFLLKKSDIHKNLLRGICDLIFFFLFRHFRFHSFVWNNSQMKPILFYFIFCSFLIKRINVCVYMCNNVNLSNFSFHFHRLVFLSKKRSILKCKAIEMLKIQQSKILFGFVFPLLLFLFVCFIISKKWRQFSQFQRLSFVSFLYNKIYSVLCFSHSVFFPQFAC